MAKARKPLSKKTRFEVFKRDGFTCQYCGQRPPAVVLECDHVIALRAGGQDVEDNLLTACFDCNRGKGARSLKVAPVPIAEKVAMMKERQEQLAEYTAMLQRSRDEMIGHCVSVAMIYEEAFPGWELTSSAMASVGRFLEKLPPIEVEEAMQLACARVEKDRVFKYFCGICWRKIRGEA